MIRIRLFCDIDLNLRHAPVGDPKQWDWKDILNLSEDEHIWVFGASLNPTETDPSQGVDNTKDLRYL